MVVHVCWNGLKWPSRGKKIKNAPRNPVAVHVSEIIGEKQRVLACGAGAPPRRGKNPETGLKRGVRENPRRAKIKTGGSGRRAGAAAPPPPGGTPQTGLEKLETGLEPQKENP